MHRMFYDNDTRPKHGDLQIALGHVLTELKITLGKGEVPNTVLLDGVIDTIATWRPELERCRVMGITMYGESPLLQDDAYPAHYNLIAWLNGLSIDLKLRDMSDAHHRPLVVERIEEGLKMIYALSCRERLVWR